MKAALPFIHVIGLCWDPTGDDGNFFLACFPCGGASMAMLGKL